MRRDLGWLSPTGRTEEGIIRVLDLFSGLVVTIDIEERFKPSIVADVLTLKDDLGSFDMICVSPPCEKFSVMTFGRYWLPGYRPRGPEAELAIALVKKTVAIIEATAPAFWVVENPRGMLRKLHLIPFERKMVTMCQYGRHEMKPTDLWGGFPPSLTLRDRCWNYDPCHDRAPRGWSAKRALGQGGQTYGGTQGMDSPEARAKIPHDLALELCLAAERDLDAGLRASDYTGTLFA